MMFKVKVTSKLLAAFALCDLESRLCGEPTFQSLLQLWECVKVKPNG